MSLEILENVAIADFKINAEEFYKNGHMFDIGNNDQFIMEYKGEKYLLLERTENGPSFRDIIYTLQKYEE